MDQDVSGAEQLRLEAERARRLARGISDPKLAAQLEALGQQLYLEADEAHERELQNQAAGEAETPGRPTSFGPPGAVAGP